MIDGKLNDGEVVFLSCPKCHELSWWSIAKHPKGLKNGWTGYVCLTCNHSFKARERTQTFYTIEEIEEDE